AVCRPRGAPRAVKILYLATRPPWPPVDGGRVLMNATIEGLVARGHEVTVVAPRYDTQAIAVPAGVILALQEAAPRGPLAVGMARIGGVPVPVARHEQPAVRAAVARLLDERRFDLV